MAHAAQSYSISTTTSLTFPRRVFAVAGWYGLIVMLPQYFLEAKIGRDYPPAITHAENFYGFIGVTVAWQLMFLIISRDPIRYRTAMLAAIVEKATFVIAVAVLYAQGRVAMPVVAPAGIDLVLGVLFSICFITTPRQDRTR
jgi:hypothetical protein